MDRTLSGVLSNVSKFREAGLCNHEVCLVVIFNGMKNMNCDLNPDIGMMQMFKEYDFGNKIDEKLTMTYKYN